LIAMNAGATLNGKALSQTAVTLIANNVKDVSGTATTHVLTTIKVTPMSSKLAIGHTLQLTALGYDQLGVIMPATIQFTSSRQSVARVNSRGLVTGVSSGIAVITASSGNVKGNSTITVSRRG